VSRVCRLTIVLFTAGLALSACGDPVYDIVVVNERSEDVIAAVAATEQTYRATVAEQHRVPAMTRGLTANGPGTLSGRVVVLSVDCAVIGEVSFGPAGVVVVLVPEDGPPRLEESPADQPPTILEELVPPPCAPS
jgi:hypothetical protein